jgi:hypothetical protein
MRCAKGQSVLGWGGQAQVSRGACVCVVFEAFLGCLASSAFFVWCSPAGGCVQFLVLYCKTTKAESWQDLKVKKKIKKPISVVGDLCF